jgi:hypothetical protein
VKGRNPNKIQQLDGWLMGQNAENQALAKRMGWIGSIFK